MKFAGLFSILFCIFLVAGLVPAVILNLDIKKIERKKQEHIIQN